MVEWLHPGLLLIAGALVLRLVPAGGRRWFLVFLGAAAVADCLAMTPGTWGVVRFLDFDLTFGRVDRLSLVFAWVFSIMALIGIIYSLHEKDPGRHQAALVYAGSALGAVFAGDLAVLFLFWELMAFSSVFLVWQGGRPDSLAAGFRYLLVHVAGGASLLAGILLQYGSTGSLAFDNFLQSGGGPGFTLILLGFILNAAVPPLSAWLTDAYPEATVTGAVFLSAFTTKTAVYALLRGFAGTEALVWLGAIMAVYGVVYATLQNDARRLLAYHIVSQVGYMVCAAGIGTEMAVNGSAAHAFAHILYKGLLFMGAGAVLHVVGTARLSDLGGLHRTMPWTMGLYMVGALSISAWPLTSGFVSKSMVTAAAGESHLLFAFVMLTLASAGTFLSVGLKLPWFMFFGHDRGIAAKEPPRNMLAAMGIAAFLCVFIGVVPGSLYSLLPNPVHFSPYTLQHVVSTMELELAVGAAFLLLVARLAPKPRTILDTDWFYRKAAAGLMWLVRVPVAAVEFGAVDGAWKKALALVTGAGPRVRRADTLLIEGSLASITRGTVAMGMAVRSFQNGRLPRYLFVLALALVAMLAWALLTS